VLSSRAVQTDDTPVPVLDRERTRTRTSRIWTYVGDRNRPYIVYGYTGNHGREGPEEFLKGYNGYLQADTYRGYDAMFMNCFPTSGLLRRGRSHALTKKRKVASGVSSARRA
jgi:Transposase IS66 family